MSNARSFGDRRKLNDSQDTEFTSKSFKLFDLLYAVHRSVKINQAISVKITSDHKINGKHNTITQFRYLVKFAFSSCIIIDAVFSNNLFRFSYLFCVMKIIKVFLSITYRKIVMVFAI